MRTRAKKTGRSDRVNLKPKPERRKCEHCRDLPEATVLSVVLGMANTENAALHAENERLRTALKCVVMDCHQRLHDKGEDLWLRLVGRRAQRALATPEGGREKK